MTTIPTPLCCEVCGKPFKAGDSLRAAFSWSHEGSRKWTGDVIVDAEFQARFAERPDTLPRVHTQCAGLPMTKHVIDFKSTVAGIPCGICIDSYHHVPSFQGSPHLCDSADDFYGYTETEFTIVDRKGYDANWLASKATDADHERIIEEITNHIFTLNV